jgi:hypothetical protein
LRQHGTLRAGSRRRTSCTTWVTLRNAPTAEAIPPVRPEGTSSHDPNDVSHLRRRPFGIIVKPLGISVEVGDEPDNETGQHRKRDHSASGGGRLGIALCPGTKQISLDNDRSQCIYDTPLSTDVRSPGSKISRSTCVVAGDIERRRSSAVK